MYKHKKTCKEKLLALEQDAQLQMRPSVKPEEMKFTKVEHIIKESVKNPIESFMEKA